jgi:DMSO/TMAO reductase YedYZ molybdopterin-dependent catalytic subunit
MKRISLVTGGLLGAGTGLVVTGLTYLGEHFLGLPFVPFDIFDWVARSLPGGLITFVIDSMVRIISMLNLGPTSAVAKAAEQSIAILQFLITSAVFGLVLAILGRRKPERLPLFGMAGAILLLLPVIGIEFYLGIPAAGVAGMIIWLVMVFVVWGAVLGRLILETSPEPPEPEGSQNLTRRQFLYLIGAGSFTILVGAAGVSVLSRPGRRGEQAAAEMPGAGNTSGPAASPPESTLEARIEPASGTRPELTANDDFYRIDINTTPPEVNAATWQFKVEGMVYQPLTLTLEDLRSRPSQSQAITLSCISNQIGGDLISTSVWTGVRLKDILDEAGLRPGVEEIAMEAVDGFYESMPLEEAMDDRTLLVYEMNGEPLPVKHGFPLRVFIPNHYGMKQPKWLTRMEAIDHQGDGYWVDRGWSETAFVKTTSAIDAVAEDAETQDGAIPVGGIAYAGARGISKVEVQVDGGPWEEAELRTPALSPLTWVQWRYEWQAEPGRHTFGVRATDGTGEVQVTEDSPPHPDGATGEDEETATVRGE